MSQNRGGRPRSSTNQPGHSAGGTRPGAGRKVGDGAHQGAPAPSRMQASRSTGTVPQIPLHSMFFPLLFCFYISDHHM